MSTEAKIEKRSEEETLPGHRLVVQRDGDDWTATVECGGVTDACRTWMECRQCNDTDEPIEAWDAGQTVFHGVEHMLCDLGMCERTEQCLGQGDGAVDSAHEAGEQLPSGRYPCEISYAGDGYVHVAVLTAAVELPGEGQ